MCVWGGGGGGQGGSMGTLYTEKSPLPHFTLNKLSHTTYLKSPISVSCDLDSPREKLYRKLNSCDKLSRQCRSETLIL